jgi:hypothetical protein
MACETSVWLVAWRIKLPVVSFIDFVARTDGGEVDRHVNSELESVD